MGLLYLGQTHLMEGRPADGMALHDAATAAATSGDLTPYFTSYIYCNVIVACRGQADWHRAAEWTEHADRWSERESVGHFPGVCRVHRAEVRRIRGELDDAERDVMFGCEMLTASSPAVAVLGFQELGEIRLCRGDLAGAEAACRQCLQLGVEAQPTFARLRLPKGDAEGALASIERALQNPARVYVENRVNLLPVKISAAIAAGELSVAGEALAELERLADALQTPVPRAAAANARGALLLAEGDAATAITHLQRSVSQWAEERAPYETAQAQRLLATAYRRLGDLAAARLEFESSLATFQRLGAALDVRGVKEYLAALAVTS